MSKSTAPARSSRAYVVMGVMLFMHLGILAIFFTGTSAVAVVVAFCMYMIRGLGVTGGYGSSGQPNPKVTPDFDGWNVRKGWFHYGGWVGLALGIG